MYLNLRSMAFATTLLSSTGTAGLACRAGTHSPASTAVATALWSRPSNGRRPVSSSYVEHGCAWPVVDRLDPRRRESHLRISAEPGTGTVKENVAPAPGGLSAHIRPPCDCTMARAILSPRPQPREAVFWACQ